MSGGEFAEIEARANAATVGPWEVATSRDVYSAVIAPAGGATVGMDFESDANAYFTAHARVDIPCLLAAVRERDNTIARVREVADKYASARWRQTPLSSAQQAEGMNIAADAVLAALDPQETP